MGKVKCPSCRGSGEVTAEEAVELYEAQDRGRSTGAGPHSGWEETPTEATCSCDGPPHRYSRGWCPPSGPVTAKNRR